MIVDLVQLLFSLVLLCAGAELLVRGGSSLARHLGLTPLVIGLTVVAFGTSAPEMIVSVGGSLRGHDDIAVGNVVGSNIFNVGFILAISALVSPIAIKLGILKLDAPLVLGVSLLAVWILQGGAVSRPTGLVLLLLLVGYTVFSLHAARREASEAVQQEFEEGVPRTTRSIGLDVMLVVAGLGLLIFGSRLLVDAAVNMGRALGVSEAVMGLTIVSAGTSMPELATSLVAALRRQSDIAVGNILGSNLFNILGILGLSATVKPLQIDAIGPLDLWGMLVFAAMMLPMFWTGRTLQRWEGGLLLGGYLLYLWARWPA